MVDLENRVMDASFDDDYYDIEILSADSDKLLWDKLTLDIGLCNYTKIQLRFPIGGMASEQHTYAPL